MKSDGWSEVWLCCLCFLCSLLFSSWRFLFSSPLLTPSCTVWRQHPRSAATSSQLFGSMSVNFMSLLQTSLKRSIGRPAGRRPKASWPYRMSLGMRPSSMRCTCPSQRIRRVYLTRRDIWGSSPPRTRASQANQCRSQNGK